MGKKRKKYPNVQEVLARPWCYYCERDFDDLKILISHQKAKHFKCDKCNRRLNTAGGLSVHMNQVHKEQLSAVENSLPNRQGLEVEIFGMEGIPDDVIQSHNQRVLQQFYEAQAERRAKSGNLAPGEAGKSKKVKIETVDEMKKRLAEWRARKAAGDTGGPVMPVTDGQSPTAAPLIPGQAPPIVSVPQLGVAVPSTILAPGIQPGFPPQSGYPQAIPSNMMPPGAQAFPAAPINAPSGLPQRPTFNAPNINLQQMQQLHQGQLPEIQAAANGAPGMPNIGTALAVDELIASAGVEPTKQEAAPEKKGKKDKDKNSRLVYPDNDISPEEKMAQLARYAFLRA